MSLFDKLREEMDGPFCLMCQDDSLYALNEAVRTERICHRHAVKAMRFYERNKDRLEQDETADLDYRDLM